MEEVVKRVRVAIPEAKVEWVNGRVVVDGIMALVPHEVWGTNCTGRHKFTDWSVRVFDEGKEKEAQTPTGQDFAIIQAAKFWFGLKALHRLHELDGKPLPAKRWPWAAMC